jgi:hypothetical protein
MMIYSLGVRKSKDGEVFQLREPALEKVQPLLPPLRYLLCYSQSLVGPYLDLSETKMHVTKVGHSLRGFKHHNIHNVAVLLSARCFLLLLVLLPAGSKDNTCFHISWGTHCTVLALC